MSVSKPTNIPLINLLLVISAGLAFMGTLAPDERTTRSNARTQWSGQNQEFTLIVNPAAEHVEQYDATARHIVEINMDEIAIDTVGDARWTLSIEGQSNIEFSGRFEIDEDGGWWADESTRINDINARVGEICPDGHNGDEADAANCIPCSLEEGCRMTIRVDLCRPMYLGESSFNISISPQNQEYSVTCHKDDDSRPCEQLGSWLELSNRPLEDGLCE